MKYTQLFISITLSKTQLTKKPRVHVVETNMLFESRGGIYFLCARESKMSLRVFWFNIKNQ